MNLNADQTVEALRAAGEPTRLRILSLLASEELSVMEMSRILDQSPFGLVNARLALFQEERNLEVALFCKNCFDRLYWTGEFDTRRGLGWAQAYYGAPRTTGVELTYRFGE